MFGYSSISDFYAPSVLDWPVEVFVADLPDCEELKKAERKKAEWMKAVEDRLAALEKQVEGPFGLG